MAIVTVFNQKGGVGKTTTCLSVAAGLRVRSRSPLLVDLDSQCHLTLSTGVNGVPVEQSVHAFFVGEKPLEDLARPTKAGLRLIPAHFALSKFEALHGSNRSMATKLRDGLHSSLAQRGEPIMIDCCPMLGVLSLNALLAADRVLIPVSADYLSMHGAHRLEAALGALESKLARRFERRIVVTRFDARRRLSHEVYRCLRARYGNVLCRTRISECVSLAEAPVHGGDIFSYAPESAGARDYRALVEELESSGFFQ